GPIRQLAKNEKPRPVSLDRPNNRINFIQQLDSNVRKRRPLIVRHVTADGVGACLSSLRQEAERQHDDQYLRSHYRITAKTQTGLTLLCCDEAACMYDEQAEHFLDESNPRLLK